MKKIFILMIGFLLIGVNLYARDLTVDNLRVRGTQGIGPVREDYKALKIDKTWNCTNILYSGYDSVSNDGSGNIYGFNGFGAAKGLSNKRWVLMARKEWQEKL